MSKSVVRIGRRGKGVESAGEHGREGREANLLQLDTRVELIQALIPIGLEAVNELLQQEVCQLAGERYSRSGGVPGYARWGGQRGSVYLADQKVSMTVPRVRDTHRGQEIPAIGVPGVAGSPPGGGRVIAQSLEGFVVPGLRTVRGRGCGNLRAEPFKHVAAVQAGVGQEVGGTG